MSPGTTQFNFNITSDKNISRAFLDQGISDFEGAARLVRYLPYGRNTNKENLLTVFTDHCGTCSTKHALLKTLADENGAENVKLVIGIFRMNAKNTPEVAGTLSKHNLDHIPEAHCYLRINGEITDCTKSHSKAEDFIHDVISETEITPPQITAFKVNLHREVLKQWLQEKGLALSLDELWLIREQCIKDLGT